MRRFNTDDRETIHLLNELTADKDAETYRCTFYNIGTKLSEILNNELSASSEPIALACASEDADWLAKGIIDKLSYPVDLCVYWSNRRNLGTDFNSNSIEYAEIEKSYEEISDDSKTLIITKSIISSSCVIKSQIMRLVSRHDFEKIYIVSPVLYKDAQKNLEDEFPEKVYDLFNFIYFAIDEDKDENGWVKPGIGGSVYKNLNVESRTYYPDIVEHRMDDKSAMKTTPSFDL